MFVAGIDLGSAWVKAIMLDEKLQIVGKAAIQTGPSSQKAGEKCFSELLRKCGLKKKDVSFILSTGYGRKALPVSHAEMTEIACHAKGARKLFPDAATVIDIGGQDSKVIALDEQGFPSNFVMNDKCAAGCGRFLEVMARVLEVELQEMGPLSLASGKEVSISSMCTVFAESEVISLIANNCNREDIARAIHRAIALRVSIMVEQIGAKERIVMTGGVARNIGVVKELEQTLGKRIFVPSEPEFVGALGAAILALERSIKM
jgi:predicted CoA-substrate-specific enzyme activase